MENSTLRVLMALALFLIGATARAEVTVLFVDPEHFVDASLDQRTEPPDHNRALAEIRGHLLALGASCIKSDQSLELRIRDVDLAGDLEPRLRPDHADLRVLRDGTFPVIEIEYVWRSRDGEVLSGGIDRVSDQNYLRRGTYQAARDSSLFFEKRMLTQWFERRFCGLGEKAAAF